MVTPARRLVLLGASNLTQGVSVVVGTALATQGGPWEIQMAAGHGRSYCGRSRVLIRSLPGIPQCGLWRPLADAPRLPVDAILTDIGNDLMYEVSPQTIAANVAECLDRLAAIEARIVVTALPLANLESLSPRRFRFFRTLFFPKCRLTLPSLAAAARELDGRVRAAAATRGASLVEQRREWYGLDPIHIVHSQRPAAWREIMAPLCDRQEAPPAVAGSLSRWLQVRPLLPQQVWLAGREIRRPQPAACLPDGTNVSLY